MNLDIVSGTRSLPPVPLPARENELKDARTRKVVIKTNCASITILRSDLMKWTGSEFVRLLDDPHVERTSKGYAIVRLPKDEACNLLRTLGGDNESAATVNIPCCPKVASIDLQHQPEMAALLQTDFFKNELFDLTSPDNSYEASSGQLFLCFRYHLCGGERLSLKKDWRAVYHGTSLTKIRGILTRGLLPPSITGVRYYGHAHENTKMFASESSFIAHRVYGGVIRHNGSRFRFALKCRIDPDVVGYDDRATNGGRLLGALPEGHPMIGHAQEYQASHGQIQLEGLLICRYEEDNLYFKYLSTAPHRDSYPQVMAHLTDLNRGEEVY